MFLFIKSLFRRSELIRDEAFEQICAKAIVLERNELGPKVMQLENGDILKLFRVKHLVSGARICSYARRFYRNAIRIEAIGIPTVKVKKLYHFQYSNRTAVLYEPLADSTLRQLLRERELPSIQLAESFAFFLSSLHQHGVHFHSLHMGNIVIDRNGALGLIDISDLSIYPWPLFCSTRVRSFKRLCRYPEEIKQFGGEFWQTCMQKYFAQSGLGSRCQTKIQNCFRQLTGLL